MGLGRNGTRLGTRNTTLLGSSSRFRLLFSAVRLAVVLQQAAFDLESEGGFRARGEIKRINVDLVCLPDLVLNGIADENAECLVPLDDRACENWRQW